MFTLNALIWFLKVSGWHFTNNTALNKTNHLQKNASASSCCLRLKKSVLKTFVFLLSGSKSDCPNVLSVRNRAVGERDLLVSALFAQFLWSKIENRISSAAGESSECEVVYYTEKRNRGSGLCDWEQLPELVFLSRRPGSAFLLQL